MNPSNATRGVAVLIAALLVSPAANAVDLNGAWANDIAVCSKIFEKKNNTISMTRDSDMHGSGFIIDGNQIRGKVATCTVKSRKEDGSLLQLVATCSTDVALSAVQFSLKMDSENQMTRVFPGIPEMSVLYVRCPL
ncbi:MAG TPA: hypothetical protein VK440_07025 [Burkholderiales bacterium]|nr:hypothetical protein [Burkholderiales bacterium]